MSAFKDLVPEDFSTPTQLPSTPQQAHHWQKANQRWWESHPMRYDWRNQVGVEEFSPEFFSEIDQRFFQDAREYMPWKNVPFEALIDFDSLSRKDVLEIGVGCGSHAMLLAQHARSFAGIDLTDYAVKATSARMRCLNVHANIIQMDAEAMAFPNAHFDFIWTWGVIHHSSNTRQVLREMERVLKPEGEAVTMVYHRNLWNYYVWNGLFQGIIRGDLFKTHSIHKTMQRSTDGALARYYKVREWNALVREFFDITATAIYGSKAQLVPVPGGKFKSGIMRLIPNGISRLLANRLRMGSFLVTKLKKR